MKKIILKIFLACVVLLVIIFVVYQAELINPIDLQQAQRIAAWKTVYEKVLYSFDLIRLHEGTIVPNKEESGKIIDEAFMLNLLQPYFRFEYLNPKIQLNYSYRKLNGGKIKVENQFYFNKFVKTKSGIFLSLKKNTNLLYNEKEPLFFMFIDVNGIDKPNKIGKDIFFINIYKDYITPLGDDKSNTKVKISCSPIGNGLYCSDIYLLGGHI